MKPTVLMGDPAHFSVVGGANPHTRDRWGRRKTVDRTLAIRQWQRMRDLLIDHGVAVVVVPPDPRWPGTVYPANAGVRLGQDFVLSHLIPTRAGETPLYQSAVERLGLRCHTLARRFEGEADLFPGGGLYLFTYGEIRRQRFVPRFGMPPWRRVYGFRSESAALEEIERIHALPSRVVRVQLVDERFYHGDTCLCSFGPGRNALLAYLPALAPKAVERLRAGFGERVIALEEADAMLYAANSFAFERSGEAHLVMPEGVSQRLQDQVRAQGTRVVSADVSEFLKKGGGSVKCMIGDLGVL